MILKDTRVKAMNNEKDFAQDLPENVENPVMDAEFAETAQSAETAESAESAEPADEIMDAAPILQQQANSKREQKAAKKAQQADAPRPRYVGRVTLGICLILVGVLITASMILPDFNLLWFAKLLPLILVAMGLEVLIASFRRGDRPVKIGFGTTLLCLVLIGGSVAAAMVPGLWKYFGPEQRVKEQQIQNQIERDLYEQIDPASFEQLQVLVNFWNFNSVPHVRIDASLAGEFESAEEFAQKALPLVQAVSSYNKWEIETLYINSNDAYGNWSLSFDPVYPWKDKPTEALAQKVNHTDLVLTQDGLAPVEHSDFERMKQDGVLATADAVEEAFNRGLAEGISQANQSQDDVESLLAEIESLNGQLNDKDEELQQAHTENDSLREELSTLQNAG